MASAQGRRTARWTCLVTGISGFLCGVDHMVVTAALPVMRVDLGLDAPALGWLVNAYTLTLVVLPLPAAALGERYGRRRVFTAGLVLFAVGSVLAGLAPGVGTLLTARVVQGTGAAFIQPLSLTLLANAVPARRLGLALGLWGATSGVAVALGPLVGGAVLASRSWRWIFWLNIPVTCALVPLARWRMHESRGADARFDLTGTVLVSLGLLGVLLAVTGIGSGDTPLQRVVAATLGTAMLGGFVLCQRRAAVPLLDPALLRERYFTAVNSAGFLLHAGLFGSVFLLAQFLQTVQGHTPLEAGLRMLPWTAMPLLVAPLAGRWADRHAPVLIVIGLGLSALGLAWLAITAAPDVAYSILVPALMAGGIGLALFFTASAHLLMTCAGPNRQGPVAGVNSALRETGGVLGVALGSTTFAAYGSYSSGPDFVAGLVPALWGGAALLALAASAMVLAQRPITRPATVRADSTDRPASPPQLVSPLAGDRHKH
ncbi:MFS transporter [Streptomyces sp. SID13588]|uniref:MFS transporter n=1 Tax=Streptomyces sp. SID13588 TaxID=2706051 RepID=UPI0013CAF149|nr:MFS transporter [Streptomyces sp. SID13588]NEA72747.1 MFS transporter [Streptomyces sp. SID13588]